MVESAAASNPPSPALLARPPTPPRESKHNESKLGSFNDSKASLLGGLTRFLKADPNHRRASAPVTDTFDADSSRQTPGSLAGKKKVVWSDSTHYNEPSIASFDGQSIRHMVQPLGPSSERKPSKSILKIASNGGNEQEHSNSGNSKLLPPHHHASFSTMLDSIIQQLGGKDRSSKMDAYLMLSGLLKASDNVPDLKALKIKMGLLCQNITHDLSEKLENGKADTGLVVNALVLLSSFLQKPAITEMFPADFPVHVVEHSIKSFGDASASKEIIKHLMFIMAQQNFSAKVMTQERVGRLIEALHSIENHIRGKSIAISRINILRTLLRSSRSHMLGNTVWFEDMFNDMLSSLKEVRTPGIAFGFEAAVTLGAESSATRAVQSLFKMATAERSFAEFYTDRLKMMVKNKNDWDSATVPQIWSIVILFLRSKPQTLVQWGSLPSFLEVIQLCFNSSDTPTKLEANLAWNRLIFALQLNEKTSPKFRSILSVALITQLKTRKSSTVRKACFSSIYLLLYYALKPQSSSAQLDIYWDEYVVQIIKGCLASAKARGDPKLAKQDALEACTVLQSLFDSTTPRKWSKSRAIDSLQPISMVPTELPSLDSKWLRKNHIRVFKVLNPLMEMLYWDLDRDSEITKLWKTYLLSIGSPAVGEVKVHLDTMSSIASMFSMLHKFWLTGGEKLAALAPIGTISTTQRITAFTRSFESIVLPAVSSNGLKLPPFTEKLLAIAQDTFIVIATPSLAPKKQRVETKSPLYHLILLLTTPSPGLEYDRQFFGMVDRILSPFINARNGKAKLELINSLVHLLPSESNEPSRVIWQVLAESATTAVDTRDSNESNEDGPLGSKYVDPVKILEIGINQSPSSPPPAWRHLFDALANAATLDAGEPGRAIGVITPIAKIFLPQVPSAILRFKGMFYLGLVLGRANYPKDRQALDSAHRKLWGSVNPNPKSASYDPFNSLYEYTSTTVTGTYESFSNDHIQEYSDIISAITGLLGRCPTTLLLAVLVKLQPGISCWIVDNDQKLPGGTSLSKAVTALWTMVKKLIPRLLEQHPCTIILRDLESLICDGLNSKHGSVVNGTITWWNKAFGSCEEIFEYPKNLKEALLRLRAIADVQVPHLPESLEEEPSADQRQPMDFMDSQDDSYEMSSTPNDSIMRLMRQSTPQVIIESRRSMSLKRPRDNTPQSSRRKSRKQDLTPRFRHDDSQVQFEAVESSPMAGRVADSQLLTDKQKETRERQKAQQSMFPDLGSTLNPRERSARKPEPETKLPTRQSSQLQTRASEERQTTPTLPIPSDDDGCVASSPTPTKSIRGEREAAQKTDPPSSPPVAPEREPMFIDSTSPSMEHTPEPATGTALASAPMPTDEDIPSSPPVSAPAPGEEMEVDREFEDSLEILDEIDGNADGMNLDITKIYEEQLELLGNEASSSSKEDIVNEAYSFGPSAQVGSFQNISISTSEFAPQARYSSPAEEDPSQQLRASQMEQYLKSSMKVEGDPGDALPDEPKNMRRDEFRHDLQQFGMIQRPDDSLPTGTLIRYNSRSQLGQRTPRVENAQASPTSSDRQDVFEDAVSSPRPNPGKEKAVPTPSTPDLYGTANDSSFLRAVDQCDQPRPAGNNPFVDEADGSSRSTRGSASKALLISTNRSPFCKLALRKTSNFQTIDKEPVSSTSGTKSSSIPSVIPETPGMRIGENPDKKIIDNQGREFDPEHTIVVDISSLQHYRPTVKYGKRKGRKRRFHETGGDSNEIPDSQDAMARSETSSPTKRSPSKRSPAKKKPRGRQSRASQVSQEASDVESSQGQSQSVSVDLDASHQEMEIDGTTMSFTSKAEEQEEAGHAKKPEIEQSFEEEAAEVQIEQTITDDVDMDTAGEKEATSPDFDVIDETTNDATDLFYKSSAVEQDDHIEGEDASPPSPDLPISDPPALEADIQPVENADQEVPAPEVPATVDVPAQVQPATATASSMIHKLQSLLNDLQTASLSRHEVGRLEDLIWDAKGLLCNAEKRGRRSSDK